MILMTIKVKTSIKELFAILSRFLRLSPLSLEALLKLRFSQFERRRYAGAVVLHLFQPVHVEEVFVRMCNNMTARQNMFVQEESRTAQL